MRPVLVPARGLDSQTYSLEVDPPLRKKKRKTYRGQGGKKEKQGQFSVLLSNIRGMRSKEKSLQKILKRVRPSMLLLNETHLTGRMKPNLDRYLSWTKNREGRGGGGIVTAVRQEYGETTMGVGEGEEGDEVLVTRIGSFQPALTVINCYGEQRSTKIEVVEEKWRRLVKKMEEVRSRGELCLLSGDLNKLVGSDELGVGGNHPEVSAGGRLLRCLLAGGNWVLVNALGQEVVEGGPWTRVDPATGEGSVLDMFVVSRELRPFVESLVIDERKEMTPARSMKKKGKYVRMYTDHLSGLLTFAGLPRAKEVKEVKETRWNLAKEGGWEIYKKLCEEASEKINSVVENEVNSIEDMISKFEKFHNKIKHRAFGKVTLRNKKKITNQEVVSEHERKENVEDDEVKANKEIEEIKAMKGGRVGHIWNIRRKVFGGEKGGKEATAIINPETNKVATTKKEIKDVTLKYCKETLKSNEPDDNFKSEIEEKKQRVKEMMKQKDGEFVVNEETFKENLKKFKTSGKRSYDFVTKTGPKFQNSVFKMCQRMCEEEVFPKQFQNTTLHMIYKGKGRREVLSENRFIHCKDWFARTAEALVVRDGLKEALVSGSSRYQVGGQPGHRPEELVFVFKSLVARQLSQGKAVIAQTYDVQKFFDKELIEDALETCIKRGADPKAVRLWFKLNENTKIEVKTAVGNTDQAEVGAVVGQGTIGGALVSQAVLDEAATESFPPAGRLELKYGEVPMAPLMWMDDLLHAAPGLDEAREVNRRINKMMKQRGLKLSEKKSVCIIIGKPNQRKEISEQLEKEPLVCGSFVTKEKESDKWLGQHISARGLADSVALTVAAREGKVRGAGLEIAAIVQDWRSAAAGGMETALLLWEACCVPSLLHGAGTWVAVSKATIKKLNQIQQWFLRLVLRVGPGTPLAALAWDTGVLDMELRIWKEKLLLVLHLRTLEEETLAGWIYKEQIKNGWPGLAQEAKEVCEKLRIEDVNQTKLGKKEYMKLVSLALQVKDKENITKQAEGKEKCLRISTECYGKKNYITEAKIGDVRNWFRTRFGLLPFAGNYSHDRRFARTAWLCKCGSSRELEDHLRSGQCTVYGDIRSKYGDLQDDSSLVEFFAEVLARREELEEEEEEEIMAAAAPLLPASPPAGGPAYLGSGDHLVDM